MENALKFMSDIFQSCHLKTTNILFSVFIFQKYLCKYWSFKIIVYLNIEPNMIPNYLRIEVILSVIEATYSIYLMLYFFKGFPRCV